MPGQEITGNVDILNEYGAPVNFGWARSPLFGYKRGLVRSPGRRITASDRYIVCSPEGIIVTEILDGGYLGYVGITVVLNKTKKRNTASILVPFSMGNLAHPDSSESGSIKVSRKQFSLEYIAMESGARILKIDVPKFNHGRGLRGAVVLTPPDGAESIVSNLPWREKNTFQYTRRSPWYIAEGVMQFGTTDLAFTKSRAWGIFDWNRIVRPQKDIRYWAVGCGMAGGRQVAVSAGYGSVDTSYGTENAFFLDGKLYKLDQVTFHINPGKWLDPWKFTSNDKRITMQFNPVMERFEKHQFFLYSHSRRQVFGSFSGTVLLDDGSEFNFDQIMGFAERKKIRW